MPDNGDNRADLCELHIATFVTRGPRSNTGPDTEARRACVRVAWAIIYNFYSACYTLISPRDARRVYQSRGEDKRVVAEVAEHLN